MRLGDEKHVGVLIFRYQALAEKNNVCAEYQITDVQVVAPPNPQIKPNLAVEPSGTRACH